MALQATCSVIQMAATSNFIDNSDKFYRLYLAFLKHDFKVFALFSPRDIFVGSFSILLIDSGPPKTVGLLSTNSKAECQMTATE